jgi:hypothetical protein
MTDDELRTGLNYSAKHGITMSAEEVGKEYQKMEKENPFTTST